MLLFSLSVVSASWPRGLQHARFPCPSLKLMFIESAMPSNHLIFCHPFLLLPSIFPSIRPFPMSWLFISGGWSTGASASASVFPMNIQGWFPLGLTGLISLQSKGLWRIFSGTIQKHQFFSTHPFLMTKFSYLYMTKGKTTALTLGLLSAKWCLCFLTCCLGLSYLFFQGAFFNFVAIVTVCSDFGAQEFNQY